MATLTGVAIKNSYKDLLQVSNSNSGVDGTLRDVEDGEGTASALKLSTTGVQIAPSGTADFTFSANALTVETGSIVSLPDGSVSAPPITFTSDTDTGIFLNATGLIGIAIGGVIRADIGGDGIYTPSFAAFDVSSASGRGVNLDKDGSIVVQRPDTDASTTDMIAVYHGSDNTLNIDLDGDIFTDGRILASGGSTTQVAYGFRHSGTDDPNTGMMSSSADILQLVTGGSERLRVTAAGLVGIGETAPLGRLHVKSADAGAIAPSANGDELVIEGSASTGLSIFSGVASNGSVIFGDSGDDDIGQLVYNHGNDRMSFIVGANNTFTISATDVFPTADNVSDCGGASNRWDDVYATNGAIQTSGARFKEDIETSDLGLEFVKALTPVKYRFRGGTRPHYGLEAGEVKKAMGQKDFAGYVKQGDFEGLRYTEFLGPIIAAIKELAARLEALEACTPST